MGTIFHSSARGIFLLKWFVPAVLVSMIWTCFANASYEINLSAGWNLVSLPEQQTRTDIDSVLGGIKDNINVIWTYTDGDWKTFDPDKPLFSDLHTIDAGQAYWIHMKEAAILTGYGLKPASSLRLKTGWNFIGFNSSTSKEIESLIAPIINQVEVISGYAAGRWEKYEPAGAAQQLRYFDPHKGYWIKVRDTCMLSIDVSIPETTKTVEKSLSDLIVSIEENKITFQGPSPALDALAQGDILAAPVSEQAPEGFLRKIVSINFFDADMVIVTTEMVPLAEAIQSAAGGATHQLTLNDIDVASSHFSGQSRLLSDERLGDWGVSFDESITSNNQTLKFEGYIKLEPDFLTHMELDNWALESFRVEMNLTEEIELSVRAETELLDFDKTYTLQTKLRMHPLTVWVGWVPVIFIPEIIFKVNAKGKIEAYAETKIIQKATASAGLLYRDQNWMPIRNFSNDFEWPNEAEFVADLKASAGPQFNVMVYGVVGPYINIMGYGNFRFTATLEGGVDYGLFVGADLNMGIDTHPAIDLEPHTPEYPINLVEIKLWPASEGVLTGNVVDSQENALLGVNVRAEKNGATIEETNTDQQGKFSMYLPPGANYTLTFSQTGFVDVVRSNISVQSDGSASFRDVTMLQQGIVGDFSGTITDALSGQGVAGAEIQFRKGFHVNTGYVVKSVETGAGGVYSVSGMIPGYYTGEINKAGYVKQYFLVKCQSGFAWVNQNANISPLIDNRQIRIVLAWGANPRDLDSHLFGPIENSDSRFHVYYSSKGNESFAKLDRDDVDSYGPETVTIYNVTDGIYRYGVHHYSGSSNIAQSDARVVVYQGNDVVATYFPPEEGDGRWWNVFEFDGTSFNEIGTLGGQTISGAGGHTEDLPFELIDLPKKQ